jgi:predicted nuclease with RNAse H fold
LGAQATQVIATTNALDSNLTKVIVDSGSNITLILFKSPLEMQNPPKIRQAEELIWSKSLAMLPSLNMLKLTFIFIPQMVQLK